MFSSSVLIIPPVFADQRGPERRRHGADRGVLGRVLRDALPAALEGLRPRPRPHGAAGPRRRRPLRQPVPGMGLNVVVIEFTITNLLLSRCRSVLIYNKFGTLDILSIWKSNSKSITTVLNPAPELIGDITDTLKLRQHDSEENVRFEVVLAIVGTAKKNFDIVAGSEELLNFVKVLFYERARMAPSESMAYTGKIRGMKEEGCQSLLEHFVKLYIEAM